MNEPLSVTQPARQTTTVFTSGNSQAVRLPKAFRFSSKTVQIERRGDEVVLREKKRTVGDMLRQRPLAPEHAQDWDQVLNLIDDPLPQTRDWETLLTPATPRKTTSGTPSRATRNKTARP